MPADFNVQLRLTADGKAFVTGVNKAKDSLTGLTNQTRKNNKESSSLTGTVKSLVGAYVGLQTVTGSVRYIRRQTDSYTELNNRIRLVTDSERELARTRASLLDISQETRTQINANTILYSKLSLASENTGHSQQQLLEVTKLLNKQVAIGGSNASEAAAGLIQFAQGVAAGRLQGDELRSVLENLQGVSVGLIEGFAELKRRGQIDFDVTRANIRQLASEGVLSSKLLLDATLASAEATNEKFKQVEVSLSGSFTKLTTAVGLYIGEVSNAAGITEVLGGAAEYLASVTTRSIEKQEQKVRVNRLLKGEYIELDRALNGYNKRQLESLRGDLIAERNDYYTVVLLKRKKALEALQKQQKQHDDGERYTGKNSYTLPRSQVYEKQGGYKVVAAPDPDALAEAQKQYAEALVQQRAYSTEVGRVNKALAAQIKKTKTTGAAEVAKLTEAEQNGLLRSLQTATERVNAEYKIREEQVKASGKFLVANGYTVADALKRLEAKRVADINEITARGEAEKTRIQNEEDQKRLNDREKAYRDLLAQKQGFHNEEILSEVESHRALIRAEYARIPATAEVLVKIKELEYQSGLDRVQTGIEIARLSLSAHAGYSKSAFEATKVLALAQATIDGVKATQAALSATGNPYIDIPLSVLVGGLAAANIAKIAAQEYRPVTAYAQGGIVDSPTFFNYGGGKRGVAGEAGPEAILPMRRGRTGNMGVELVGGMGGSISNNISINVNVESQAGEDSSIE